MTDESKNKLNPPYIPFKTFTRLIQILKETIVPDVIDSSVLSKFSGSDRAALLPAIKFLGLTDKDNNVVRARLEPLVNSYQNSDWKTVLRGLVESSYTEIINGLPLATATRPQLQERFKNVSPSIVEKAMRFYTAAAEQAGITLCKFIKQRKPREKKMKFKPTPKSNESTYTVAQPNPPAAPDMTGYKEFSLPLRNKKPARILVPEDIGSVEWEGIKKMIQPILMMIETYFGFESKKEE